MLQRVHQSGLLPLALCVVYAIGMSVAAPGFASVENAKNVWLAMLPLLVAATGQTVVLIAAGIDLSVTSTIALASVTAAGLATSDGGVLAGSPWGTPAALLGALVVGGIIGGGNGWCVACLQMPPFIVTLTSMMAVSGLAVWWTQSRTIYNLPASFLACGQTTWLASLLALGLAVSVQWLLSRSLFGLHLRAVGHNSRAAYVSGVPVIGTIVRAYMLCGLCAGLAAVLITGQLETGSPVQWENNLLDVIGATVIGGTSLYGGRGNILWTASGVLLLALIDNSLNLLNLSHFTIMMAKGGVILVAALLDTWRNQSTGEEGP